MAAPVTSSPAGARRRPRPGSQREARARATHDRILGVATIAFGTKGFDAVSLDDLAAELGVTKQAILYHHPSKRALLDAVIDRACLDLVVEFDGVLNEATAGWERIESLVRAIFRTALRRPELLGLVREVTRLGGDASLRITGGIEPFVERATAYLAREMDAGRVRRCDPRMLLVSAYSAVLGVATEVEVLRAVGVEPTLRDAAVRRRELLSFLRAAIVAQR